MRRVLALSLSAVAAALLAGAEPAGADVFGPISLVSENTSEQAQYAHDPAISGDGRYVAFDGLFDGLTGVWRKDRQSGAIEPVAVGQPGTPEGSAKLPSISEDGRYISFTTTAPLDPVDDTNSAPDVYVRDMEPQPGEPVYELASAVDGSAQGLTYSYGASPSSEEARYGSLAAGRSALSADGRKVAFVTTAVSDLAGPSTPALQVAVRDLDSKETQLVSVAYDPATDGPKVNPESGAPEPVSTVEGADTYGAVYIPSGHPPSFTATPAYGISPPVGASISADGSTVAWMGVDIGEQVQLLPAESRPANYTEPLWRRIGEVPGPTHRVTGGSEPANPACVASGEGSLPQFASLSDPCQGPFAVFQEAESGIWTAETGDAIPQLSADGDTVAFLANAPLVSLGLDFGGGPNNRSDLYVVNMEGGLTRNQALRQLTELASGDQADIASNGPVTDLAISADGNQVAFTTKRTEFPLGSPAYVSPPAAEPGLNELFDVDLADDTLTRVTHGYEGGASEHPHPSVGPGVDPYGLLYDGAVSPSFSTNGQTLAFSSTASNLSYGDGNTPPNEGSGTFDGSDAFVVEHKLFRPEPTEAQVSSAPPAPALVPSWRLSATALSRRDGSVALYVELPGAGTLRVGAESAVRVKAVSSAHSGRRASRSSSSRGRHSTAARGHAGTTVATRTVATTSARASVGGLIQLTLRLARAYSARAGVRGGLSATVSLVLAAPGHPNVRLSVPVTFLRTAKSSRSSSVKRKGNKATKGHGK